MDRTRKPISKKRKYGRIAISLFCTVVVASVVFVLTCIYAPSHNALRALASVSMDVICIAVLLILIENLAFEQEEMSRTTKLFLALMLANLDAVFFDFLNWAFDGLLEYSDYTYVFTLCSLVMGSVLAALLIFYLSSYMKDMYNMKGTQRTAVVCGICNAVAFVVTLTLGVTKQAFEYVDGHYKTGALYDMITIIPVLSILYMTAYVICHFKKIGLHDTIAVSGYIVLMVIGALIESEYSIGTTYVAITIAGIIIFVMLQDKMIDRMRKQRERLSKQVTDQFEILESMAGIYSYVNYVGLDEKVAKRFDTPDGVIENLDLDANPHTDLNKRLYDGIEDELKDKFWAFTDLSTLPSRIKNEKIISAEFCHKKDGWFRAQYIRIGDSTDEPITRAIYAIRNIDEEKKNVEKWIRKSNTDELTGFFNRHAYEDEIAALKESKARDNFVYVSIDINSLKLVNDTLGHDAGDELIVGACECMKQCMGSYGKLFRTGGDEFVGLIYADDVQLADIQKDIEEVTENWKGTLNESVALSCGYVTQREAEGMSIHDMAVLADRRMYEAKNRYYQKKGIDRRGQRDAHAALCALYTKILKINITEDTYQIINMNLEEQTSEMGFAETISQWLTDFGKSGQVHPDDLEEYLSLTNIEYMRDYFKSGKKTLNVMYHRKYEDGYRRVIMEMVPAGDYSDESQNLFLYVKDIEK